MKRASLLIAVLVFFTFSPLAMATIHTRTSPILNCQDCLGFWADFNGDGLDDLLVRNRLYLNAGGRLSDPRVLEDVTTDDALKGIGDFNGDHYADLLVFKPGVLLPDGAHPTDGPTRMLLGNGAGRFTEHPMPAGEGEFIAIADFTGDGKVDLLRWDFSHAKMDLLRGNGDATFAVHQQLEWPFPQAYSNEYFASGDVNGDGRKDIVTPHEDSLLIYLAQADGTFGAPKIRFTRVHLTTPNIADMNGDGMADLVFNNWIRDESGVTVLLGDGTGRFPGAVHYAIPRSMVSTIGSGGTPIAVGDFVAGGATEVAVGQVGDGYVSILGVANGALVEVARVDVEPEYPRVAAVHFTTPGAVQIVMLGQVIPAPRVPVEYRNVLIETEGVIPQQQAAALPPRRRAIGGLSAFVGGRYLVSDETKCPISSLQSWTLEREGMFVNVIPSGSVESGESVYFEGEVFLRLRVKDGATTRVLEGSLQPVATGLRGSLFEWSSPPCGGLWSVHRVEAGIAQ